MYRLGSDDTPAWFQSTNHFYTLDHADSTQKAKLKMKSLPKTDVFDQPIKRWPKLPETFIMEPPHSGMRYVYNERCPLIELRNSIEWS
jgi:hypothetical protein